MSRRAVLFSLGVLVTLAGECALPAADSFGNLVGRLGPVGHSLACFMQDVFPPGIALAIGVVLLGTLMMAWALGLPPEAERPHPPAAMPLASQPAQRNRAFVCLAFALALALVNGWFLHSPRPPQWTFVLWVTSMSAGLVGMLLLDRIRHTRVGNPLPVAWEWGALVVIVGLDLILVGHDLTHWRWSGIPDESEFFGVAKSIMEGTSNRLLLSERGVFGVHPVLSSAYQSLFMELFGENIFGWRLSSAASLAFSLPFVYLLTRELWNRRAGFFAAILFGCAQLAVDFSHFGYNNVQVYPVLMGALAMMAWACRGGSVTGYYLAGCLAGLGFYTFYPTRLAAPLLVLLTLSLGALPLWKGDRLKTLALVLGVLLPFLPVVFREENTIGHMLQFSSMTGGQYVRPSQFGVVGQWFESSANLIRLRDHWLLSMVYAIWYKAPHHFTSNPMVDPISAPLAVAAFWLGVAGWRRCPNLRFLCLTYTLSALLVGSTSPHFRPPLTRLLFLAPFTAMLSAVAADQLLRRIEYAGHQRTAWTTGIVLIGVALTWNVGQLHYNIYHRFHGYGTGTTPELVRIAQKLPSDTRIVYVQRDDSEGLLVDLVLDEYEMNDRFTYLQPSSGRVQRTLEALKAPVVVFYDLKNPREIQVVEASLRAHFPTVRWQDTDAGKPWSLRYFYVPSG
jgi:4-amino-4-deoxy-L-arabinose transferase-like glycosyltransferase